MKILIVEDDEITRLILDTMLKHCDVEPTICSCAEDAIKCFEQAYHPLLLVDLYIPGMDGFEFCRWVRAQPGGNRHLILVGTASDSLDDLRRVLDAGADDYIIKPYQLDSFQIRLAIAKQRVHNIEVRHSLTEQLKKEHELLAYQATHDPLTQLDNRSSLTNSLQTVFAAAKSGPPGALIYLDLDNFKIVNDTLGHAAGDRLLIEIAHMLRAAVRGGDVVYRIGGDEFVIVLQATDMPVVTQIAERLRRQMEGFVFAEADKNFHVGASMGVVAIDGSYSGEATLNLADAACYAAKNSGRNRIVVHRPKERKASGARPQVNRRIDIKAALLMAIQYKQFELVFQPVVAVHDQGVAFYEALVRLPMDGVLIKPDVFLPIAERGRLMPQLDACVIEKAAATLSKNRGLTLSINLSGQSFGVETLPDFIESKFRNAGVEPERVIFEVTETAIISNLSSAQSIVQRLRERGYRFALDDFGVGYSAFNYLKELPADYLKIDGSFVRDAQIAPTNWIFIETIKEMSHKLQMQCVAEHVEDTESLARLRAIGMDLAQGYFFGAPAALPEDYLCSGAPVA